MRWLDFSTYNMRLVPKTLPSGRTVLVMIGGGRHEAALKKLGFRPTKAGHWYTTRYTDANGKLVNFSPTHFKQAFPKLFIRDVPVDEVLQLPEPTRKKLSESRVALMPKLSTPEAGRQMQAENGVLPGEHPFPGAIPLDITRGLRVFRKRLKSEFSEIFGPLRTVAVLTDYDPEAQTDSGPLPMKVTLTEQNRLQQIVCYANQNGQFVAVEVYDFDEGTLASAWAAGQPDIEDHEATRRWLSLLPALAGGALMPAEENVFESHYLATDEVEVSEDVAAKNDFMAARLLGVNYLGEEVYEGVEGRFLRGGAATDGGQVVIQESDHPARFLRAGPLDNIDWDEIALCADGFVSRLFQGHTLDHDDLIRFAGAIFDLPEDKAQTLMTELGTPTVLLARPETATPAAIAESAIAGALSRAIRDRAPVEGVTTGLFQTGVSLHERLPVPEAVGSHPTPLPIAFVAQRLLGSWDGPLLAASVGDGEVVSALPSGVDVRVLNEHEVHLSSVRRMLGDGVRCEQMDLTRDDFSVQMNGKPERYARVLAVPRPDRLRDVVRHGDLNFSRMDHLVIAKALDQMADDGRAVLVLGTDTDSQGHHGLVTEARYGSRAFFDWLSTHYHVEGAVEIDGGLCGKRGAERSLRLVVVTGRKRRPRKEQSVPAQLEVLRDWGNLWAWSEMSFKRPEVDETIEAEAVNDYQMAYIPASDLPDSNAMVPRNLFAATRTALAEFEERHGKVDDFIRDRLQYEADEPIGDYFSAEQADALALAIARFDDGRGFMLGDETGIGKGRVLAGVTRYATLMGFPVVFCTFKPELFSDFWRDIADIGSADLIQPFVLNAGTAITDQRGEIVCRTRQKDIAAIVRTRAFPLGKNLVMSTYSQFNTVEGVKSRWLPDLCRNAFLILDESHTAAGKSNTGQNFRAAIENAAVVANSSATFAKEPKNMDLYSPVLPPQLNTGNIEKTLIAGGEPLQEIFVAELAKEGVVIRREHSLGGIKFETVVDQGNQARNEQMTDRLAEILGAMGYVGGDISKVISKVHTKIREHVAQLPEKARSGNKMGVSSMAFSSRLYLLTEQFLLSLKSDFVADLAITELRSGRKPIIALENTMESMVRELMEDDDLLESVDTETDDGKVVTEMTLSRPPQYRDALYKVLDRMFIVRKKNNTGEITLYDLTEREAVQADLVTEEDRQRYITACTEVRALIDQFPDLPMMPIDRVIDRLEQQGFTVGEISGRKVALSELDDGRFRLQPARTGNRNKMIREFNNGQLDAVILSRSGTTGISLHASRAFADQRQRCLIEMQIMRDVKDRVQLFGRANRKGQVCPPRVKTVDSGLPAETRSLSMQNAKLRRLSANTTSNRDNAALADVTDILNKVGDEVCLRLLENNPDIANKLAFEMDQIDPKKDCTGKNNSLSYRVTGRLMMLDVATQRRIYNQLSDEYETELRELEAKGINPFQSKVYDVKAKTVDEEVFEGVEKDEYTSIFDRPVYLRTINYEVEMNPMRWEDVCKHKELGRQHLLDTGRVLNPVSLKDIADDLESRCDELLELTLTKKYDSVEAALAAKERNQTKAFHERMAFVIEHAPSLGIGQGIEFTETWSDGGAGLLSGIITAIKLPEPGREYNVGQFKLQVACRGEDKPRAMTLHQVMSDPAFKFIRLDERTERYMEQQFNRFKPGTYVESRILLDGNLFNAVRIATEINSGTSVVYTDENSVYQRGILMPRGVNRLDLVTASIVANQPEMVTDYYIEQQPQMLHTSGKKYNPGGDVMLSRHGNEVRLIVPAKKPVGEALIKSEDLKAMVGSFSNGNKTRTVKFPASKLPAVMQELYNAGVRFRISGESRAWVNRWLQKRAEHIYSQQAQLTPVSASA